MRALKIILIVFSVLILLVGSMMAAAVVLIDPNDYKNEIAAAVQKQTGRELVMQGNISLSVFPWLGVTIDRISLGNAQGFTNPVFAGIDKAELRIKIMPLFKKQVEVGTIVLDGLQVNLERLKNGKTNWDDLATTEKTPQKQQAASETKTTSANDGFALAALAIDGVQIKNGTISWKDAQANTHTTIDNVELTATQIALSSPFALFFGFNIHQTTPAIDARITLKGSTTIDPQAGTYDFSNAMLTITGSGPTLPGGRVDLKFSTDITANLPKELLDLNNIALATYGIDLKGKIAGTSIMSAPTFQGDFTLATCNPRHVLEGLGQKAPETADPSVLKALQADLAFKVTQTAAQLTALTINLDQTTLKSTGSVKNFASPAIAFTLDVDAINVDSYLPPKNAKIAKAADPAPKTTSPAEQSSKNEQAAALPLPIDQLRTLDLTGKITVGKLTANSLTITDILIKTLAKDGRISMDPIAANLYEGAFKGSTLLDVRGKTPKIAITENLSAMQVGPLLKDMTGKDTLTGTTKSTASLQTAGMTPNDLKANLNGKLDFSFSNGSVKGINIPKMLRDAVIQVKGGTPDPKEVNQTDFASLGGTATITNGLVDNRDLLMMSPLMRLTGEGTVNLPKEGIDYLLTAKVVSTLKGQQGEPLAELAGLSAPIRITGTFDQPKFKLDLASIFKEKGVQELKEKVTDKIFKDKKASKLLKGLFN